MKPRELIRFLTDKLAAKDYTRLNGVLQNLIEENQALGGPNVGFLFHGEFHSNLPIRQRAAAPKQHIHASLMPAASQYVLEKRQLATDLKRIGHGLSIVLMPCKTTQDVRDALPDLVKDMVPDLKDLSRTRPEAFTIAGETFKMVDYKVTEDLIAFYVANQILY